MKTVFLVEPLRKQFEDRLREVANVVHGTSLAEEDIVRESANADAIVIRAKGRISKAVIENATRLKVIGRHGVGVDHIDLAAARQFGVKVLNTPNANFNAVAEYVVGTVIHLMRNIRLGQDVVEQERPWSQADQLIGSELNGRTIGIAGFGRIGRRVAEIMRFGFQMKILYWDYKGRLFQEAKELNAEARTLLELASESDIFSVHFPLNSQTDGMISSEVLTAMKDSAYFVNTSRGQIVDQNCLLELLKKRQIAGAVLDVTTPEPLIGSPLQQMSNVVLTPHMSSYTEESFNNMGAIVEDVIRVLSGEQPMNEVAGSK